MADRGPSGEALALFFRSLATLFKAGVSLPRSLRLLGEQSEDKSMRAVAAELCRRLDAGSSLGQAMALHQGAFTSIQLRMVQIGERTGTLDTILAQLAQYEEKRRTAILRFKSALTYPAFLLVLCSFALIVLPPYMFSGLFQMISQSGTRPPLITVMVIGFSNFVRSPAFWVLLVAGGVGLSVLGPPFLRQPQVRRSLGHWILGLPVAGRLYRLLAVTAFARTMALQLAVGDSPLAGLKLTAEATGNPILEECIPLAVEGLRDGGLTLVDSLARCEFFPKSFLHMVRAGEETAEVAQMMSRVADLYEADLEQSLDTFTALLEPLVMLGMGVVVGIIVVATMLPMMQLIQNL